MAPIGGAPVDGNDAAGGVTIVAEGEPEFAGGWPTCPGNGAGNAFCADTALPVMMRAAVAISGAVKSRCIVPREDVTSARPNHTGRSLALQVELALGL